MQNENPDCAESDDCVSYTYDFSLSPAKVGNKSQENQDSQEMGPSSWLTDTSRNGLTSAGRVRRRRNHRSAWLYDRPPANAPCSTALR
jgi:hypothetical protein